jgi:hypothetical protein
MPLFQRFSSFIPLWLVVSCIVLSCQIIVPHVDGASGKACVVEYCACAPAADSDCPEELLLNLTCDDRSDVRQDSVCYSASSAPDDQLFLYHLCNQGRLERLEWI